MIKKFLLSFIVIVSFTVYAYFLRHEDIEDTMVIATKSIQSPAASPLIKRNYYDDEEDDKAPPPQRTPILIVTTSPSPASSLKYRDGQFTGVVADAYYGPLQVKVTISKGQISDVVFLQYPNDRRTSIEINTQAMPYLKQEAIQAQNAQVDIISGATQTSEAFVKTLQSALKKAV